MIKPIRAALLLALAGICPAAALDIISPFQPIGPIDPSLLLDPQGEKPGSMDLEGRLLDLTGQPIAGGEVLLRWVYPPAETPLVGDEELDPSLSEEADPENDLGEEELAEGNEEADLGEGENPEAEGNGEENGEEYNYVEIPVTRHARSDAKGYFRLTGIDPEQWVTLEAFLFSYTDGRGGAAIMTNGQNGGALASEICVSLAAAYGWKECAPEVRTALTLTPEHAAQFAGAYIASIPGQPDLVVTITPEGEKLWVEAAPYVARQRFYVASETQAFTINSPVLAYTTDKDGKPQSIEVARGIFAIRKT